MTKAQRKAMALQMTRELQRLEQMAVRTAGRITRQARLEALRAYRAGRDPAKALAKAIEELEPVLLRAMVTGYLVGREQTIRHAGPFVGTAAFSLQERAISQLARRQRLTAQDISRISDTFGFEATKTIRTLQQHVVGRVGRTMNEVMVEQLHRREGMRRLRGAIDSTGLSPGQHNHLVETVLRTEMQMAYGASRWQSLREDEAVDEILWGFEYVAVGDDRTRPGHLAHDGIRLPKDDPFWQSHWPPNGWNCRCTVLEIFTSEQRARHPKPAEPRRIDKQLVNPEPDRGWEFNPGTAFQTPALEGADTPLEA